MPNNSDHDEASTHASSSESDDETSTHAGGSDSDDETWEKAGGGFGPIKNGGNEGEGGKPAGFKPGERADLEVKKYQGDGGYLIPKRPFQRLVREIFGKATEDSEVTRIEKSAIEALQNISESHVALVLNGKSPYDPDKALAIYRRVVLVLMKLNIL